MNQEEEKEPVFMKKIFLYAYNEGNLGDDLFVETITNRYKEIRFYIWGDRNNHNFDGQKNLRQISERSKLIDILYRIRPSFAAKYKNYWIQRCAASVYIGGSIFIEYPTWKNIVNWWKYQVECQKFYVLGANFGPYHTEEYRIAMGEVFSKMEDVCFRDRYSYKLFEDSGSVRYSPDILFGCEVNAKQKENKVFVSVIDCLKKSEGKSTLKEYDESYKSGMTDLLKRCLEKGYDVVIASFCQAEGDEAAAEYFYQKLKTEYEPEKLRTLKYNGTNRQEMLEELETSEYVIGTRFHSVILGLSAGCKVLPIVYSDKTKYVLEDIAASDIPCIDLRKEQAEWRKDIQEHHFMMDTSDIERIRRESQEHFSRLDKLLRK